MSEGNSRTATTRYFVGVGILLLAMIGTGTAAIWLSISADATLSVRTVEGSTVQKATYTGEAIGHLWRAFWGILGSLIGYVGAKVV